MIGLLSEAHLRAPRYCKHCEIRLAEFAGYCLDCYEALQEEGDYE